MHELSTLDIVAILLFLASIFTYVNIKVLKLPTSIGLMVQALGLSSLLLLLGNFIPGIPEFARDILDKLDFSELLLNLMLSFLLFAGALSTHLEKLREEMWPILTLATVGILITTAIIGTSMYMILPLLGLEVEFIHCLLFGALISPTDPIAVLAMLKNMKVSKSLEIKIAGESLFNDGIGVVIFLTLLHLAEPGGEEFTGGEVALLFGQEVIGGLALGAILGYLLFHAFRVVDTQHVELEVLMTLAGVIGGTQIAHVLHVSAPLAMVVAGLFIGNEGRDLKMAEYKSEYIIKFWHLLDEVLNAILFMLIGLEMLILTLDGRYLWAGLLAIPITVFSRLLGVGIPIRILRRIRPFEKGTIRVLTWGGLRGGISVALALSLPSIPEKGLLVSITYLVVIFSIVVQGLTLRPFIDRINR
ncbi:MAG TPA: sodium:proton antiporter [Cytophagales bacterium]|nr:sodium:proton antiporter [Cytophagales bacterium]HAA22807.1 sodium:proton antiporter [Cytophagales bacterium]HAP65318.1 sodium:proton antiporter [Cytophagales bacterium]